MDVLTLSCQTPSIPFRVEFRWLQACSNSYWGLQEDSKDLLHMEYWAKARKLQSHQAALVAPTLTVGLCTQQQRSSWKLGGGEVPTQPTKAVWHIITGGSQKVQILPTLDRKQPKWISHHSDPRAQLSPGWGQKAAWHFGKHSVTKTNQQFPGASRCFSKRQNRQSSG